VNESRSRRFGADTLMVLASALFLLITVQPVLTLSKWSVPDYCGMPRPVDFLHTDFYSFKSDYLDRNDFSTSFADYWFGNESWQHIEHDRFSDYLSRDISRYVHYTYSVSPIPTVLFWVFVLQISTPILGFVILPMKPRKRLIPLIPCLVTVFLMTWIYLAIYKHGVYQLWSLATGYWLTCVSSICYSVSIILTTRAARAMKM
jgi:hypothetical protein